MVSQSRREVLKYGSGIAVTTGVTGCLTGSGGSGSLTFAGGWPENDWRAQEVEQYFMDRVSELSDESIEWQYHPDGQIGGYEEMFTQVQNGTVDIAITSPNYISDAFYLTGGVGLPGIITDPEQIKEASKSFWNLLHPEQDGTLFEAEFKSFGIRPVIGFIPYPSQLVMAEGESPVRSVDDVNGKVIRAAGDVPQWTAQALGGTVEVMTGPESYQALQQGTVDGSIMPLTLIQGLGFQEVVGSMTDGVYQYTFPGVYSINLDTWNSLSSGTQEAINTASTEVISHRTNEMHDLAESARADLKETDGYEFVEAKNVDSWLNALEDVETKWIENASDSDLASKVIDKYKGNI